MSKPARQAPSSGKGVARWRTHSPSGSVLLIVLAVVAILTLATASTLDFMQTELEAVRYRNRTTQTRRLAESGVESLRVLASQSLVELQRRGGLHSNSREMLAVIVDEADDDFSRGRFTVLAPAMASGAYGGVRYGLEDESAKLNVNSLLAPGAEQVAIDRLLALPGMTPETAAAILDWLDLDDAVQPYGAEIAYYQSLDPPYAPPNGPISDLDELLAVRGVTPELLYGRDRNRNLLVDGDEPPRGLLAQMDDPQGLLARGWSAYLTVHSVEGFWRSDGSIKIDLNQQNVQALYDQLKTVVTDGEAKFIVLARQYGAGPSNSSPSPGGGPSPGGQPSGAPPQSAPQGSASYAGGPAVGGAAPGAPGASVSVETITLDLTRPGTSRINSLLDLVGAQVQMTPPGQGGTGPGGGDGGRGGRRGQGGDGEQTTVADAPSSGAQGSGAPGAPGSPGGAPPGGAAPTQTIASPWQADSSSYRKLLALADASSPTGMSRVAGRINVNAASRVVLGTIPGFEPATIEQIIARRLAEPDQVVGDQRHVLWLLVDGLLPLEQMKLVEPYVTARGDVFSGQAVGFYDASPAVSRMDFVIDRSAKTPRIRAWHDLTHWGPGFSLVTLGVESDRR
jgi:hypothetical protein